MTGTMAGFIILYLGLTSYVFKTTRWTFYNTDI